MGGASGQVFVCYARVDKVFARRLAATLEDAGLSVWIDQDDIRAGTDWSKAIDDALAACSTFLIILSSASVESVEVKGELLTALDGTKKIVPVLYEKCTVPRQLKSVQHIDVSGAAGDEVAVAEVRRVMTSGEEGEPAMQSDKDKAALATLNELLNHPEHKKRSLRVIKKRLPGYSDAELRSLLTKAKAVAFEREDGEELWGLLKRNPHA